MVDRMISPFTLMAGPILFVLSMILIRNIESWDEVVTALCIYIVWVLVSRTLRIIPHFYRCPGVQFPCRCYTCSQCEFVGVQGAAALSLLSRTRGLKSLSGCLFHQPDTVGTNSLFCFWAEILFCALMFAHPVEAAVSSAIAHPLRFSVERSGCSCCSVPSRAALCPHVLHAQRLLRTHCLSAACRQAKTVTWPPSLLMSRTCRAVAVAIPSRCRCREAELAHHTRPSSSHASSLLCRVVPAPHPTVERPPQQPSTCWLDSRCSVRCNSIAMQSSHALSHSTTHNRCRACTHSLPHPAVSMPQHAVLPAEDITYLIFFIGYQYYFAVLKLYALFTLHVTSWGTREGVAAAGVGSKDTEEVDPEVAHEQRVQMAKKGRTANKTYQKGNIALMRRIHMHNLEDDGVCCFPRTCRSHGFGTRPFAPSHTLAPATSHARSSSRLIAPCISYWRLLQACILSAIRQSRVLLRHRAEHVCMRICIVAPCASPLLAPPFLAQCGLLVLGLRA